MPYRMTPSVRHRAIEVYYYYYNRIIVILLFPAEVKTWNGRGCNDRPSIETKHQQQQQPQQAQPTKSPPGPTTDEAGLLVSTADPFIFSRSGESHGSGSCPWIVEVLPGQRINLTVYNFPVAVDGIPDVVSACALRITIGDRNRTTTVSLCNDGLRHKRLYISDGNKISVHIQPAGNVFVSPKDRGMTGRLLLKYQSKYDVKLLISK